ncbi:thioredoxin domain-containing protein [Nesterenkonia sp. NBAIMH1]|uniref:DsbA family protein n=1 Tax=Nesterenkonia sp. NBAIMH1 TaxID=2600320 RepID=UPI0011B5BC62|nr:thioredoxin domain-containing protein [Nesterenkonia sp. NBAIMH1]
MPDHSPTRQRQPLRLSVVIPILVIVVSVALTAFVLQQAATGGPAEQDPEGAAQGTELELGAQPTDADAPEADPSEGPGAADPGAANPGGEDAGPEAEGPAAGPEAEEVPDMSDVERRDPDDPLAVGPADAPAAIVMFTDFQCPFCAVWHEETLPVLMDYVEDGDLRIEWRDVNVFGEASERAARAAYAAALQDELLSYHALLFPDGETLPESQLSQDGLTELAREAGLDAAQFDEDMNSPETAEQVAQKEEEGMAIGAFSTPSFIVAGEPIAGAQPTGVFVEAVDRGLDEAD